jgi:hypothetical protein
MMCDRVSEGMFGGVRSDTGKKIVISSTINSATIVSADVNTSSALVCLLKRYFSLHDFLLPG